MIYFFDCKYLERCKLLIYNVADKKIVNKLIGIREKGRSEYPVQSNYRTIKKEIVESQRYDYYFGKNKLILPPKAYTNIVFTYKGEVSYVDENEELISMKYLGFDKIKSTFRYQYKNNVFCIDVGFYINCQRQ